MDPNASRELDPDRDDLLSTRVVIRSGMPAFAAGIARWLELAGYEAVADELGVVADVVIVTDCATEGAGLERVVEAAQPAAVIFISSALTCLLEATSLQAGVSVVLPTSAGFSDLCAALAVASSGERVVGRGAMELLTSSKARMRITDRQREVLRCLMAGMSTIETARALHLTESTVKTHVRRLVRRGRHADRRELVAHAELLLQGTLEN